MKSKSLSLLVLGIFSLLLIAGFASAQIVFGTSSTLSQTGGSFDISVTSNETETIALSNTPIAQGDKEITFAYDTSIDVLADTPYSLHVTYSVESGFDFFGETYSSILTANGEVSSDNATTTLTFAQTPFCAWDGNDYDNNDDLDVSIKEAVIKGFGEDWEWYPYDEIEVEVRIKASGSDDLDNIKVEWGIFNRETGEWTIDVDEEKDFDLKDGDSETKILSFKLEDLAEDLEDLGNGDFVFYVRATGDVDNDDNDVTCASDSQDIEIVTDDNFVIVDNIEISESVSCGTEVQVTADVWNLGDDDEEKVYVIIYNKELGINEKVTIGDIDEFENKELNAVVQIPENAEEKDYILEFSVYNEDGIYKSNNNNKDKSEKEFTLNVEGSCSVTPKVSVVANLETESAVAGKEITIKSVITNTGSKTSTYLLNIAGYADWASELDLDKNSLTLDAGESEEVLITLKINKDVSGEKEFNIELVEGNKILAQPVKVEVEKSSLFPNLTGWISGIAGDNWYLWGIGALNVLLVLIIIIVAVKVSKKKE